MDAYPLPASSLFEAFLTTSSRDPQAVAWIAANPNETRTTWTWFDLRSAVMQTISYLIELGVASGDRVANTGRNCAPWAILDLACSALGAIHAPIDSRYPSDWIERCIQTIDAKVIFCDRDASVPRGIPLSLLGENRVRTSRSLNRSFVDSSQLDDAACILFTSGTTSYPRGVVLSHRNLLSNSLAKLEAMPQTSDDLRLNLLPFSHAYARTCELSAWILAGGTMACAYGIQGALDQAKRLHPQLINAVPLFYEELENKARSLSETGAAIELLLGGSIRRLASGGAPLREDMRMRFEHSGFPIFQGYGLTEASPVVCSNRDAQLNGRMILDGVGPLVRGVRLRIDSERRIWVAGDGVMLGYWRDPHATSHRIIDGWLDTGDLATTDSLDDRQTLKIEGRWDDLQVLSNGYKFSPRPLEHRLVSEIEAIEHCVLFGSGRTRPLLAVQLAKGFETLQTSELMGQVRDVLHNVEDYACPASIWIDPQEWTLSNGCLHWKGGPNRHRIQARIDSA